jgi:hypothetical protein
LKWGYSFPAHHPEQTYLITEEIGSYRNNDWLIPFLRYQRGMSRGLYMEQPVEGHAWLGTFAYYDPDSPGLLRAMNALIASNKISALRMLGMPFSKLWKYCARLGVLMEHAAPALEILGGSPEPTPDGSSKEYADEILKNNTRSLLSAIYYGPELDYSDKDSLLHYMYAEEDVFDQILASYANDKNYDVVILKRMAGHSRQVTEMVDVRSRQTCFENLYLRN